MSAMPIPSAMGVAVRSPCPVRPLGSFGGVCSERSRTAQDIAPHPLPTGTGRGEESGAACVLYSKSRFACR